MGYGLVASGTTNLDASPNADVFFGHVVEMHKENRT
jgi:hypothetical protein